MANIILKERAQQLRKIKGMSIKEISEALGANKSTVSNWCKNIFLNDKQIKRLMDKQREAGLKGSLEYSEKTRNLRLQREKINKEIGKRDIGKLSKRDLYVLGLALYWAEGYKKGNEEVGFTNSDPQMINLVIKWFGEVFGINKKDFILRISINEIHECRIVEILKFWSVHTKIPFDQFSKTSFIKSASKKVYSNTESYYGILRIKVRRGVNLRNRILGAIEFLSNS